MSDAIPDWLAAFREWAGSQDAPQFPSRHEEMEAEDVFRAGWAASAERFQGALEFAQENDRKQSETIARLRERLLRDEQKIHAAQEVLSGELPPP